MAVPEVMGVPNHPFIDGYVMIFPYRTFVGSVSVEFAGPSACLPYQTQRGNAISLGDKIHIYI